MPRRYSRRCGAAAGLVALILSGCYEYEEPPPPAPAQTPVPSASAAGPDSSIARPSQKGAKQAAQRTVDQIEERQRELEKALEDQDG